MKLIKFEKHHYQILIDWIKDEETLFLFAGIGMSYPLTIDQLKQYFLMYPDRKPFLGLNTDGFPIAFGEIIPQDELSSRLGHLLIGESQQRGKGIGEKFIKALNQEAKAIAAIKKMELYVLEGNALAINCYQKSGFQFIPNDFKIIYKEKVYNILKMTLIL
ncbi:MAG: GNAT family N-acetyltransferase [Pelobium sp.]